MAPSISLARPVPVLGAYAKRGKSRKKTAPATADAAVQTDSTGRDAKGKGKMRVEVVAEVAGRLRADDVFAMLFGSGVADDAADAAAAADADGSEYDWDWAGAFEAPDELADDDDGCGDELEELAGMWERRAEHRLEHRRQKNRPRWLMPKANLSDYKGPKNRLRVHHLKEKQLKKKVAIIEAQGVASSTRQPLGRVVAPPELYIARGPARATPSRPDTDLDRAINASRRSYEAYEVSRAVRASRAAVLPGSSDRRLPCGLTERQVRELQTRDLTPEDYELLLLLESQVKPKTLSASEIAALPRETLAESLDDCTVCLTPMDAGSTVCRLPCGHVFHAPCIEHWLANAATTCPLDKLPVR